MISNASPLIVIAKIELLKEFIELYELIEITPQVYEETITKGLEAKKQDVQLLNSLFQESKIKIVKLNQEHGKLAKTLLENYNLDKGEAETIALVLQLNKKEVLMDEALGRKVAKFYKIKPKGTLRVLLELYEKRIIDEKKLKIKVSEIIGDQFRLDAEVLNKFWELFEKIKRK